MEDVRKPADKAGQEKHNDEALRVRMRTVAEYKFEQAKIAIEQVSKAGGRKIVINVMEFETEPHLPWVKYLEEPLIALLKTESLSVAVLPKTTEPAGSTQFDETRYCRSLLVSW